MDIKVGDYIRDNDPRFNGRTVKVLAVVKQNTALGLGGHVVYQAGVRKAKVKIERIWPLDGPKRNNGWTHLGPHAPTAKPVAPVLDGAGRV